MALVEIENLSYQYGKLDALSDITLSLPQGEIIGLLGQNGAGKTTLIKILCGLLPNYTGQVRIDGQPIGVYTKSIVSYLPDKTYFRRNETIGGAIRLFRDFYKDFDEKKAREMVRDLWLTEKQKIYTMSKGTQEKLQIVLVMSRKAKLYVLDEPMAGIDPVAREYIRNTILRQYTQDATLLLSTHLLQDVEQLFDRAIFMQSGKILRNVEVDTLRAETGLSLDQYFREVFG